ncbi:MAG: hypothetical protein IPG55_19895 [Saprospiraceae bacterium]|jgi:hypothetical protein|nr:hypothetical protein [Candidatus Defluviibacterium haderslevense]
MSIEAEQLGMGIRHAILTFLEQPEANILGIFVLLLDKDLEEMHLSMSTVNVLRNSGNENFRIIKNITYFLY